MNRYFRANRVGMQAVGNPYRGIPAGLSFMPRRDIQTNSGFHLSREPHETRRAIARTRSHRGTGYGTAVLFHGQFSNCWQSGLPLRTKLRNADIGSIGDQRRCSKTAEFDDAWAALRHWEDVNSFSDVLTVSWKDEWFWPTFHLFRDCCLARRLGSCSEHAFGAVGKR
jgi:hypothetical protein